MSIEKLTRRAFRKMLFWRLIGDLVGLLRLLLGVCEILFTSAVAGVRAIERTVFYLELEAARRYKTLNGVDLGYAVGEPTRYAGLDARRAADVQQSLFSTDDE